MRGPPRALPSGGLASILVWAAIGAVLWLGVIWVVLR